MRFILALTLLCVMPVLVSCSKDEGVSIENPYIYVTTKAQRNGAAFMIIHNKSGHVDRVVSAQSDVADRVELHTHMMDGDVMMMRKVDGYDLPASHTTILEPSGHHIMLMGLKAPLTQGESFPLTLHFEKHAPITVSVYIKSMGAP